MVEKLIHYQSYKQQQHQQQGQQTGSSTASTSSTSSTGFAPIDFNPYAAPSTTSSSSSTTPMVLSSDIEEGKVIEEFYESSLSQLTYFGLSELHSKLNEGELCVFFRNNHFSTLYKFNGALYLLVTDQGFLREPVVWEKLIEVEGDSIFYTDRFERAPVKSDHHSTDLPSTSPTMLSSGPSSSSSSSSPSPAGSSSNPGASQFMYYSQEYPTYLHVPIEEATVDNDYLLAYKLQQTELDSVKQPSLSSSSSSRKKEKKGDKDNCIVS